MLNYRLAERIAQEELATVYRATHLTLERPVQVHILRRTDWISASRFQLAARLAARLSHPNLLPVVDAGHDDHYGDYLVTPRIEARSLVEVLADGPMKPVVALKLFTQLSSAVDYLHSQGVVHRDIQPANILVTKQEVALLGNFSLAAASDTPDLSAIEEADYLTPYSAPEQNLTSNKTSPSQDIYSLGAVLYQMLSGKVPPPPGQEIPSLTKRDPKLAGADKVIKRLMASQASHRYSDAGQAVAALRQALRQHIDDATDDMEESRWDPVAEWLDNPIENALNDLIKNEFISKSRARADALHRVDAIRRLLDRWSRQGYLRRQALGQFVQPEQIVSYNLYFYELKAHYETRSAIESRYTPYTNPNGTGNPPPVMPTNTTADVWKLKVPELGPFVDAPTETIVVPQSQRSMACTECKGTSQTVCATCKGKGTVEKQRRVKDNNGEYRNEAFQENCPTCRGYGKQQCSKCEGSGQLLEEKFFVWSRFGMQHSNEDDLSGLHRSTVLGQAQEVYSGKIDPFDQRWRQAAPLQELLETAIQAAGKDGRIINAELTIRAVPITEIDYEFKNKPHTVAIIGFENEVRGDVTTIDLERMILYAAVVILTILLLITIL